MSPVGSGAAALPDEGLAAALQVLAKEEEFPPAWRSLLAEAALRLEGRHEVQCPQCDATIRARMEDGEVSRLRQIQAANLQLFTGTGPEVAEACEALRRLLFGK